MVVSEVDAPMVKRQNKNINEDGIVACVTALGGLRSTAPVSGTKNHGNGQPRCPAKNATLLASSYDDLIHLPGPLTEDAVLKCLQARFAAKQYHVSTWKITVVFCSDRRGYCV